MGNMLYKYSSWQPILVAIIPSSEKWQSQNVKIGAVHVLESIVATV